MRCHFDWIEAENCICIFRPTSSLIVGCRYSCHRKHAPSHNLSYSIPNDFLAFDLNFPFSLFTTLFRYRCLHNR